MNEKHLKQQILHHLAEQGVPADYDPWEAIQEKLERTGAFQQPQGQPFTGRPYKTGPSMRLVGLAIVLLILATGAIFFATPEGRALAQGLLRFFNPTGSNQVTYPQTTPTPLPLVETIPTEQPTRTGDATPASTATFDASCSARFNPKCTLQQAQNLVDFPLVQFGWLPDELYFQSASVEKGRVTAMYACLSGCTVWLEQERLNGRQIEPIPVGPSAIVEQVQVGSGQGEFVEGSYYGKDGAWSSDSGVDTLRWQQEDILYTISAFRSETGVETTFQTGKETLVDLAEGLTQDLAGAQPLNPNHLTSVADAQTLAGFEIYEPARLPDDYQFGFATYDAKDRFVCLHYAYKNAAYPSLFIRQSPSAPLTNLQGYPGSGLETTAISIGGAEGEARFVTGFAAPEGACDRQNNIFRASQALLWRAKGMTFEIYSEFPLPFGGAGLDQNELIDLAESISGVATLPEKEPASDRFTTISDAEKAAGFHIQAPTKLPAGNAFELVRIVYGSALSLYSHPGSGGPAVNVYQCPLSDDRETPCLHLLAEVPADSRETVQVNGAKAVYAKGSMGKTPEEENDTWHLQDPALTQRLYWRMDGWDYLILSTNTGIDKEGIIAIAESMR